MRRGLCVLVGAAALSLAGCFVSGATSSSQDAPSPTSSRQTPLSPGESATAGSTPSARPGSLLDEMSAQERAEFIAQWGEYDCAPWSLIIDYDSGLITPEEFTGYAMYPFGGLGDDGDFPLPLPVPERYQICDVDEEVWADTMQMAGLVAELYVEDIDPAFRDQLWLSLTGQTYEEANRPLTDDEVNELNCLMDPEYCD